MLAGNLNSQAVKYMQARVSRSVLIITASHQTFSGQFWCLSGQNKFDLTHLLYIINGKVSVFLENKVMSGQISTLIITTARYKHTSSTQGISRKLVLRLPFKSNVFSEGTGNSAIILLPRVKTP